MGNLNARKLLLVDGIGALISAFLLGVVLVALEPIFGIPRLTLYFLALLPCLFAFYDFYYYQKKGKAQIGALRRIAYINIGYCFLSFAFAVYHIDELTLYGWAYIIVEIIIVLALAVLELKAAKIN